MLLKTLKKNGVLSINRRNAFYIMPLNPRENYPKVDNKILTKELAEKAGIPVPKLYGIIRYHHEINKLEGILEPYYEFVIKPARGAMGNGILIIDGREGDVFIKSSGKPLDFKDMRYHVSSIISGMYSLAAQGDWAMVEYRIKNHPVFEGIAINGVPDVRIIVYRGFPIMAMIRLPTKESDGRANLHQGAMGVGVKLSIGTTFHAFYKNNPCSGHPDTGKKVIGIQLPHWDQILTIAALSYEMTGLGYLGVDIVIDPTNGPMILEMNARPGLSIQIANMDGLESRIETLNTSSWNCKNIWERIEMIKGLF